jgi:hypothetical protein
MSIEKCNDFTWNRTRMPHWNATNLCGLKLPVTNTEALWTREVETTLAPFGVNA